MVGEVNEVPVTIWSNILVLISILFAFTVFPLKDPKIRRETIKIGGIVFFFLFALTSFILLFFISFDTLLHRLRIFLIMPAVLTMLVPLIIGIYHLKKVVKSDQKNFLYELPKKTIPAFLVFTIPIFVHDILIRALTCSTEECLSIFISSIKLLAFLAISASSAFTLALLLYFINKHPRVKSGIVITSIIISFILLTLTIAHLITLNVYI